MSLSAFIVSPSPFTLFLAGFILIALEVEVCMSQNTSYWISEEAEVSLRKPKDGVLISGDEITLKCGVDGLPQPLVTWYHNQQPITLLLENTYSILEPNKLRIHKLSALEHNGVYTCKGENEAGTSSVTTSFVLSVAEPNLPYLSDSLFSKTTVTLPGRDVWLHCMFVNAESICWVKGVNTQLPVYNSTRSVVYPNGTLHIKSVKKSDEKTYVCQGVGADGSVQSFTAELKMARLGRFNKENLIPAVSITQPTVIAEGQRLEIDCVRPQGVPTPSVRWLYRSSRIPIQNGPHLNILEGTKLVIEEAHSEHANNYTCVAENMVGSRELSVEIAVTETPQITRGPINATSKEERLVQLPCEYTGSKPPWTNVTWLFNGQPLHQKYNMIRGQEITVDHTSGTLTILKVKSSMEGFYSCVVYTQQQPSVSSVAAYLSVSKLLRFYPPPRSMVFERGSTQSIRCQAVAQDTPSVSWHHVVNNLVRDSYPDGVSSNSGTLTFTDVQNSAVGQYMCVASVPDSTLHSLYGPSSINTTISISVGVSPTISYSSKNQTIATGDTAMLHCEADGDPAPHVTWDKDGAIFEANSSASRIYQLSNNSLLIGSAVKSDQGIYRCVVGNIRGLNRVEIGVVISADTRNSTSAAEYPDVGDRAGIGMTKTIVIAVSASVAYLILVIVLIAYCGLRRVRRKRRHRVHKKGNLQMHPMNEEMASHETERLMSTTADSTTAAAASLSSTPNQYISHEQQLHNGYAGSRAPTSTPRIRGYESADSSVSKGSASMVKYDRSKLVNIGVLGNGMYGDVFLAKAAGLSNPPAANSETELVCVKRLTSRDDAVRAEFKYEMEMYHKLRHIRISRLLAVCREMDPIYMVLEYCEWGDLKQFLLATSNSNGGQELTIDPPTTAQKLAICHQVATAMNYLASRRFIHKDLASRNVLIEPNLNIKVSSLGLSKDIYASEYVQNKAGLLIPLRWTAPEAWLEDDYSTKSDVWSFGCFLFEVFSGGNIPYSELTNEQVLRGYEKGDLHPITGDCIPQEMQSIAYQCWSSCLKDRPDFSQILTLCASSN